MEIDGQKSKIGGLFTAITDINSYRFRYFKNKKHRL
jgi:hypothetical protein